MDLWETKAGDRWLCGYCQRELAETIAKEKWRLVFKRNDPELRCSECNHSDLDIED